MTMDELNSAEVNVDGLGPRGTLVLHSRPIHQLVLGGMFNYVGGNIFDKAYLFFVLT